MLSEGELGGGSDYDRAWGDACKESHELSRTIRWNLLSELHKKIADTPGHIHNKNALSVHLIGSVWFIKARQQLSSHLSLFVDCTTRGIWKDNKKQGSASGVADEGFCCLDWCEQKRLKSKNFPSYLTNVCVSAAKTTTCKLLFAVVDLEFAVKLMTSCRSKHQPVLG